MLVPDALNQVHMALEPSHGALQRQNPSKLSPPLLLFYLAAFDSFQHDRGNKYASVICCHGNCLQHEHQLLCSQEFFKEIVLRERRGCEETQRRRRRRNGGCLFFNQPDIRYERGPAALWSHLCFIWAADASGWRLSKLLMA